MNLTSNSLALAVSLIFCNACTPPPPSSTTFTVIIEGGGTVVSDSTSVENGTSSKVINCGVLANAPREHEQISYAPIFSFPIMKCTAEYNINSSDTFHATPALGYHFSSWSTTTCDNDISSCPQTFEHGSQVLKATFELDEQTMVECIPTSGTDHKRKILHLGDSLSSYSTWELINAYETDSNANSAISTTVSFGGMRIDGSNLLPYFINSDNWWKNELLSRNRTIGEYDGVVIALGTNDIRNDLVPGALSVRGEPSNAQHSVEERIDWLLEWVGNRPVYWILPHYAKYSSSLTPQQRSEALIRQAKTLQLRASLVEKQYQYPNLIIAADFRDIIRYISNGEINVYDYIKDESGVEDFHFDEEGTQWFAWWHARLASTLDPDCTAPQQNFAWDFYAEHNEFVAPYL